MLAPDEQKFLHHVADVFLDNVPAKVINSISFGTTLVLYLYALWLIKNRGYQGYSTKIVVASATVCFIASVIGLGANLTFEAIHYQTFADKSSYGPTVTPESVVRIVNIKEARVELVQYLAYFLILGISDALVLWRTQALYPDTSKLLIRILTTSLVATSVCLFSAAHSLHYKGTYSLGNTLYSVAQSVSFFTNLITTFLVGYKLWRHRHWRNSHLDDLNVEFSPVQKKMLLIVETGFAFCIIQAISTIMVWMDVTTTNGFTARYMTQLLQFGFAANYTPILLILLQTKNSVTDSLCILDNPIHLVDQDQPIELSEFQEHYVDEP